MSFSCLWSFSTVLHCSSFRSWLPGGDGSSSDVRMLLLVEYLWIAFAFSLALVLLRRGSKSWLAVSLGTLPIGWAISLLLLVGAQVLGLPVG